MFLILENDKVKYVAQNIAKNMSMMGGHKMCNDL